MVYTHKNSKGINYTLNKTMGKNGREIFFFSKESRNPVDLPGGFEVIESPLTKLPLLKKIITQK